MIETAEIQTGTHTWQTVLGDQKKQSYFQNIMSALKQASQQGKVIYPPKQEIFNAFKLTPYAETKVVIIGQDPYHGPNQAMGLCFSVNHGVALPPSLKNIYVALENDLGIPPAKHGCLSHWASQGVLLLNATLTVEAHKPQSHAELGWQTFTDIVIERLNEHPMGLVFMLWGSYAQKKAGFIDGKRHHVLKAPHPSPLSAHRGFLTCRHFSQANDWLQQAGREPIDWRLPG